MCVFDDVRKGDRGAVKDQPVNQSELSGTWFGLQSPHEPKHEPVTYYT